MALGRMATRNSAQFGQAAVCGGDGGSGRVAFATRPDAWERANAKAAGALERTSNASRPSDSPRLAGGFVEPVVGVGCLGAFRPRRVEANCQFHQIYKTGIKMCRYLWMASCPTKFHLSAHVENVGQDGILSH